MDFHGIAKQFITQYYDTFAQNRAALINFYNDFSVMTYNGTTHKGLMEITEKI